MRFFYILGYYFCRELEQRDYSVFEMRLMPTYDFIQELLSMGDEVEVLAPDCVRQEMKRKFKNMGDLYR